MSGEFEEDSVINQQICAAQEEAEQLTKDLDDIDEETIQSDEPPVAPRLLQVPQSEIQPKTNEAKDKTQQLDLLLLKAESYSHFILESQTRAKMNKQAMVTEQPKSKNSNRKGKQKTTQSSQSPENIVFSQPKSLVGGKLLDYQLEGLQWLLSLWENGISGILADEMGLGKTIQIISLIAHLRDHNTPGPFLIAGPLATIPNWCKEFKKWLPSCPVLLYHGTKEERQELRRVHLPPSRQKDMNFPILITSFEILMIDRAYLEHFVWQYLILDEGHRIKNRDCRLVRELKSIRSVSRLLLTGTPIQNTLEELWSLLNFCSPMIFDDLRVFKAWFGFRSIGKETQVSSIIETEQKDRVVSKLHEILRPFLLRRMKKDVLIQMPPKIEIVVYCGMTSLQREYSSWVRDGTLRDNLVSMNIENAHTTSQINAIMNYRKICNHPFLFGEPRDPVSGEYLGNMNPHFLVHASGKFKLLDRMLPLLKAQGHKVLIFSQMTELLSILEDYLLSREMSYRRLDGSTAMLDRQQGIEEFNDHSKQIFAYLLSTRAGGLGINLTAADTVILFDSDWNPHQDAQAQDRCHRYGQDKPVVIYRLLTSGSVEIEMMKGQVSKRKLERLTVVGGDFSHAGKRGSGSGSGPTDEIPESHRRSLPSSATLRTGTGTGFEETIKSGGGLTLSRLRQLLLDDVQGLEKRAYTPQMEELKKKEEELKKTKSIKGLKKELIDLGVKEEETDQEEEWKKEENNSIQRLFKKRSLLSSSSPSSSSSLSSFSSLDPKSFLETPKTPLNKHTKSKKKTKHIEEEKVEVVELDDEEEEGRREEGEEVEEVEEISEEELGLIMDRERLFPSSPSSTLKINSTSSSLSPTSSSSTSSSSPSSSSTSSVPCEGSMYEIVLSDPTSSSSSSSPLSLPSLPLSLL